MFWNAKENDGFSDEQGARPGRGAIDVGLFKRLTYQVSDMAKATLGTFDNDAKACYDRIIISLAMLVSRKVEITKNAVKLHGLSSPLELFFQEFLEEVMTTGW
jgi:hypothetical protein